MVMDILCEICYSHPLDGILLAAASHTSHQPEAPLAIISISQAFFGLLTPNNPHQPLDNIMRRSP